MFDRIRPKVPATETPELLQLFTNRKNHLEAIAKLDAAIIAAASKTPTYAFIKGISSNGRFDNTTIENDAVVYEMSAHNLDQRLLQKSKTPVPSYIPTPADRIAQLGEKTVNSLLNGKTLTPGEKRKLVEAMLPVGIFGSPDGTTTAEAQEDDDRHV